MNDDEKPKYTKELAEDLKSVCGIDPERELADIVAKEISEQELKGYADSQKKAREIWLKDKAEKEDACGGIVSVGGLITDIEKLEKIKKPRKPRRKTGPKVPKKKLVPRVAVKENKDDLLLSAEEAMELIEEETPIIAPEIKDRDTGAKLDEDKIQEQLKTPEQSKRKAKQVHIRDLVRWRRKGRW